MSVTLNLQERGRLMGDDRVRRDRMSSTRSDLERADPIGRDPKQYDIDRIRRENPNPYGDATCRSDRLSPPASKAALCGMRIFEGSVTAMVFSFFVLVLCQLNGDIDYSIERWRDFTLALWIVFGFWTLVAGLAGAINWYNESNAENDNDKSERGLPILPPLRWGLFFVTAFWAAFFTIWIHIYWMVHDDGITVLTTEALKRQFRWKIWQINLTCMIYLSLELVDWFQCAEVMMNWVNSVKPCDTNNKMKDLDESSFWNGLVALWDLARVIIFIVSFALLILLGAQLYTRNPSYLWDVSNMRLTIGTTAGVFLGMWFLLILGLLAAYLHPKAADLKCLRRYIWQAWWFTAAIAWSLGTLWYLMWKFIDEGRLLDTADNRQRYDNYLWWSFIVLALMFVNVYFQEARCRLNGGIRKAFCRNCHDF